ncbi:MAG: Unknown protein [uncultured Thiotrichaceae bacterium]|uniref:Uncharacterized protein n=1 Tax=uncultured Thiotrichaceae bacterium TaxID=298394 RepID=A0A6S6U6A9_9GAMM|nr:MAG: Unknown protein [uncultured Thiotrichaceae bacterium]
MAAGNFVQKQLLIDQVQQAILAQDSVFFSILTDMKRSVLLHFSMGQLIHSYCRGRDVTRAIEAINECQQLKFTRSKGQPKEAPEVMQAHVFLGSIGSEMSETSPVVGLADAYSFVSAVEPESVVMTAALQEKLVDIARDYIGLVADMLVVDICSQQHPPSAIIEKIAQAMPAKAQSDAFRERALALMVTD